MTDGIEQEVTYLRMRDRPGSGPISR